MHIYMERHVGFVVLGVVYLKQRLGLAGCNGRGARRGEAR